MIRLRPVLLLALGLLAACAAPPARWWTAFADPGLDRAVETALRDGPDLSAAWGRLLQAEAVARREGADRFPSLTATGSTTRMVERVLEVLGYGDPEQA